MTAADYTLASLVVPSLQSREAAGAILELAQAMEGAGCIPDAAAFQRAALQREALAPTSWLPNTALPHARVAGLDRPWLAFGRSPIPLAWGERTVRCLFLLAVPEDDLMPYLDLLSSLARVTEKTGLPERLLAAPDTNALLELLRDITARPSPATRAG